MEQELTYKKIAVVGLGAAGGLVSVLLTKNPYNNVFGFDFKQPFSTLLPTGGGRCNITFDEDDIKYFVSNYPRGEKFLLSVFSKFNQVQTRKLFKDLGIDTYVQKDKRVFPVSNSAQDVAKTLSSHLNVSNFNLKKEKVTSIYKEDDYFVIETLKNRYHFNYVIVATGGKGFEHINKTEHTIIEPKASLCSLDISENNYYKLSGLGFKNVVISAGNYKKVEGDILFTHKSITGPAIFKIAALSAYENFNDKNPLELNIKLTISDKSDIEDEIKNNCKKSIKNVFSKFAPYKFIEEVMTVNGINPDKQASQLNKTEKEILINSLINFKVHVKGRIKNSEIVTAGGIDLDEVNSKTMESKIYKGLYFIGEILNIDGYTGGFNLQNCWSDAYICSLNF